MLILLAIFRELHVADSGRERRLLADSNGCRAGEICLSWPQCPAGSAFLWSELKPVLGAAVNRNEGCETVIFVTAQV